MRYRLFGPSRDFATVLRFEEAAKYVGVATQIELTTAGYVVWDVGDKRPQAQFPWDKGYLRWRRRLSEDARGGIADPDGVRR